jgi:RNA polymerase sigma factor (sigma-70 family)
MHPTAQLPASSRSQPDDAPSDEALLAGLGRGDPGAGGAFVRQYQRRVYGLAKTIVGDPTQAEDIAQEALTRAWRHAGSYDSRRGPVATWVLTMTRNLAVDSLRRKTVQPADPQAVMFLGQPARGPSPEESATIDDDANRVRTAVSHLPMEQRRAVVLAAFYGYTAREISEAEAIPLGTAKTRVRSGLIKVRGLLGSRQDSHHSAVSRRSDLAQMQSRRRSNDTRAATGPL